MNIVKMFYDLETTGLDFRKHSIHQIAGIIEIDGEVVEEFDIKTRPHPKAKIEEKALRLGGVTKEQVLSYQPMREAYGELTWILNKYQDKYKKEDRIHLVGFNNRHFDDDFFFAWFEQNKDSFFFSRFWSATLDVLVLSSQYLIDRRLSMPSFKLKRVALELGLDVDEEKLHDGVYDVKLTRQIYRIVTGLDFEI